MALALLPAPEAWAQKSEPDNAYLFPAGGQRGTEVTVAVEGENITASCDFHLRPTPGISADAQTRGRRITLRIAADARSGIVPWRVATANGGTGSRGFVVGEHPEVLEVERGPHVTEPQPVTLPVTVNGRVNPQADVDRFSFELRAGQALHAEVTAARLGGPIDTNVFTGQFGNPAGDVTSKQLDASLKVYGPDGALVAQAEDTFGLDPALGFRAPKDGRYTAEVYHLAHLGMPQFVYRLTLAPGPLAETVEPEGTAAREAEPNDAPDRAGAVSLPAAIAGRFLTPGDTDLFRVTLRKGETWRFEGHVQRLGSPTDADLSVLDASGAVLAGDDDGVPGTRDPRLWFTAPADGEYLLRIRETGMSRLGERLVYRLEARPQAPDFEIEAGPEAADLSAGGSVEVNVTLRRLGGFNGPVEVTAEGLPAGITAGPLTLAPNQAAGKLRLSAAAGAKAGSWAVRIVAKGGEITRAASMPVTNPAEVALGSAPRFTEDLLVTVRFPAPFKIEADDTYTFMNLGTLYPAKVTIAREPGFTAPLLLTMADRQPRDPQGVTFDPMTVTDLKGEVFFPMRLPQGPRGNPIVRVYVKAEGMVKDADGRERHVLQTSPKQVVLRTQAPVFSLEAETPVVRAAAGSTAQVRLRLGRTAAVPGPAEVRVVLPDGMQGVSMDTVSVPAGESGAVATLRLAPGARPGRDTRLWLEAATRRADTGHTVFFRVPVELDLR